jgi:uncharacterized protein YdhG (YjbR/CyaY superfamily)
MAAYARRSTCNPELTQRGSQGENIMRTASVKSQSAKAGSAAPRDVDEYFAGVPEPARSTLHKMRAAIRSAVPPEATEAISYRIPAFKYHGPLVWYAAFSDHCSLFPTAAVIVAFKKELKDYTTSKGTIHFPLDTPLPTTLLKKLVKARVAQQLLKKQR